MTFEVHDDDLVTPLDADGCPLGGSHFKVNGFSYQASVELMADLQRRAEAGDKAGLANLIFFPLRVNHGTGKPLVVKDRAAFLAGFDHIFTPAMLTAVHALDPRDVFCNYQGVAAGHGLVWANVDKGRHGVTVINQP